VLVCLVVVVVVVDNQTDASEQEHARVNRVAVESNSQLVEKSCLVQVLHLGEVVCHTRSSSTGWERGHRTRRSAYGSGECECGCDVRKQCAAQEHERECERADYGFPKRGRSESDACVCEWMGEITQGL
jgi:hypothetical protein